jgi:hypothetical protein
MESGPEGTRANGHANGDKKHASETETAQMEEYLKRTTPQALLEHMKLYGCFDQLRSALTKELIDSVATHLPPSLPPPQFAHHFLFIYLLF